LDSEKNCDQIREQANVAGKDSSRQIDEVLARPDEDRLLNGFPKQW
jgi:hypothetical protein